MSFAQKPSLEIKTSKVTLRPCEIFVTLCGKKIYQFKTFEVC